MDEVKYILNPNARIVPFDSGSTGLPFQVILNRRRIAVSAAAAALFSYLKEPRTAEMLEQYAARNCLQSQPSCTSVLDQPPFSYFVSKLSAKNDGTAQAEGSKSYLLLKRDIFSAEFVNRLAKYVEFFFAPRWACMLGLFIVVVHVAFFLSPEYRHPYTLSFTVTEWIEAWIGAYLALLFHELGHCAACTKYGSRAGSIGIGLYLIWPVLYADTTDSWTLSRRHRAIVDVSGIYFHLIASAVCVLLGKLTSSPVLIVISKSAILSTIINLNPFFRFDGYWLVTDLTGIPNIRQASAQFWRFLLRSIWDKQARTSPPRLLRVAPQVQLLFGLYCISSVIFFGNIMLRLFRFLPYRLTTVPYRFEAVWFTVVSHPLSLPAAKAIFLFLLFLMGTLRTILFATRRAMRGYRGARSLLTEARSAKLLRNC